MKVFLKIIKILVRNPNIDYDKKKRFGEEAVNVTQFVQKIHNINLPPHQLKELGLSEGWQKKVSAKCIEKIVNTAERFKKDLKELSKR